MKKKAIITIVLIAFLLGLIFVIYSQIQRNFLANGQSQKADQVIGQYSEEKYIQENTDINSDPDNGINTKGDNDLNLAEGSAESGVDSLQIKSENQSQGQYKVINLIINGQKFRTEIADTSSLQRLGLSGRAKIGESEAMLFIFPTSAIHSFWMKDMNFAIDIIWINADKKIVHIESDVDPSTYPEIFSSKEDAMYVLEVKSGTVKDRKIKVGDIVKF